MNDILRYMGWARKMDASSPAARATPTAGEDAHSANRDRRHSGKSKLEQEEIFGPVLVVIKSRNFDHALEIANDTEFSLTGAVYSSSRESSTRRAQSSVGNLYPEPHVHGAMVGAILRRLQYVRHRLESGGPDYLYLFTQGKCPAKESFDCERW
jgi:hypothetical protein